MASARVLLITNEDSPGDAVGQIDAYRQLVETGEIAVLDQVSHRTPGASTADQTYRTVLDRVQGGQHDVVVIWSPSEFPSTSTQFSQLEDALGSRLLLYFEGDAWGRGKAITQQMRWWCQRADIVFSVGGSSLASLYVGAGAKRVVHTLHTYCHVKCSSAEAHAPLPVTGSGVVVIGSNLPKVPYLTGLPGSAGRRALARRLRHDPHVTLSLFGPGWPKSWSVGQLPFARQTQELRKGRVSANWDHYPQIPDYGSDRMAISLIAGRPHVTTRHPGGEWLPGEENGFFRESSPRLVHHRVRDLLEMDPSLTYQMGVAAHSWARHRVSHREAARHILTQVLDDVALPPADPWAGLPGPWGPTPPVIVGGHAD